MLTHLPNQAIVRLQHKEIIMRSINILDDIEEVLYQSAIAIPDIFGYIYFTYAFDINE